jgi:hypothetical protein
MVGLPAMRPRCSLPLNSVLRAKSLFLRNFRAAREPEQCVRYALNENHAQWALGWDRSTWDVPVSRGAAACGVGANCSGELDQNDGGGFQDSERDGAGAAAAERGSQGDEAGASEIVLGIDRGLLHSRRAGHAALRIHVAGFRREKSDCATISATACARVLRFRPVVCYRNQLSRMGNGAVRTLA